MGRVLVMDTNLLLGAQRPLLEALREHGHVLRISVIALEERLARATGEGVEPLHVRLRNIAPYIDAADPIAPQGAPLYARLGIIDPDPIRQRASEAYNRSLPSTWERLVGRDELRDWQRLARAMKGSIDDSADVVHQQVSLPRAGVTYEKVYAATQRLCSRHPVTRRFGESRSRLRTSHAE